MLGFAAAMSKTPTDNAQGIPNPFTTLWNGGRELLRSMSYYEMKNRAGVIGRNGLGPMLGKLAAADPGIRIHLMGHSFGARLVAYSLSGLPPAATGAKSPVKTLYLIQGAFSHFAFANPVPDVLVSGPGALSAFTHNVNGPLLSTFTAADRAVGWWYPAASALAHQDAEAADDLTYQWGGMGHDGYQQPPPGGIRSRSRRRERRTASSRACSTCSTPTPSSPPISHRSAAPTATSGTRRWSGRWSTPPADGRPAAVSRGARPPRPAPPGGHRRAGRDRRPPSYRC